MEKKQAELFKVLGKVAVLRKYAQELEAEIKKVQARIEELAKEG